MQTPRQPEFKITPSVKREIVRIIDERIREAHVTKEDFSELKAIVKELAEAQKELAVAQKRTEARVEELAVAQKELAVAQRELAEAQKRTEARVEELAEAQKKTEQRLEELAEAQKRTEEEVRRLAIEVHELRIGQENLRIGQENLRKEVGGLARSSGYAFENEAYRMLPKTLRERYGIELKERLIRKVIDDTEINILGIGMRDGKEVVVVGEAKVRLEDMGIFDELEEKVKVVEDRYSGKEMVRVLVTHIASGRMLREAEERGVIVIQSFEWDVG